MHWQGASNEKRVESVLQSSMHWQVPGAHINVNLLRESGILAVGNVPTVKHIWHENFGPMG